MEFDRDLRERARRVFRDEDLLGVVLRSHLILERGIEARLCEAFKRPEVFSEPKIGRLGFAHKLIVFTGLFAPSAECEELLSGFNRLRNQAVHKEGLDLETAVARCLPGFVHQQQQGCFDAESTLKWAFVVALAGLGVGQALLPPDEKD